MLRRLIPLFLYCASCSPTALPEPSGPPKPSASASAAAPPPPDPCEQAREGRRRAEALSAEGKLWRAARVVEVADRLCPGSASESRALRAAILPDLGQFDEARELAAQLERAGAAEQALGAERPRRVDALTAPMPDSDEAKAPMRALFSEAAAAADRDDLRAAREKYLAAWAAYHPNGQALVGAGLAARALGDAEGANRLFDRAIADLERATGARLSVDVPNGFAGATESAAFSPSGKLLAIAHGEYLSLLDTRTRRERLRLEGHTNSVAAAAFSPDGAQIATGSFDTTAILWEVSTGRRLRAFTRGGHTQSIHALAFHPKGALLATGSGDKTIGLWNVATGELHVALEGHAGTIESLAFSPDGARLASASVDRTVILWDVKSRAPLRTLRGHAASVRAVAFSPDGRSLASGSEDGSVRLWDVASRRELRRADSASGRLGPPAPPSKPRAAGRPRLARS